VGAYFGCDIKCHENLLSPPKMLPPALKDLVIIYFATKRQKLGGWKAKRLYSFQASQPLSRGVLVAREEV